jgi:hypothetical protein
MRSRIDHAFATLSLKAIDDRLGCKNGTRWIRPQNGQTLYPTPAPSALQDLFDVLLPTFGFFIPWGQFAQSDG